ncbi:MAG: hypothetical protein KDD47_24050, partial [Acidobacteria bacterium]|nr:hypothetical protein [Acidobacteriota bacterium]
MDPASRRRWVRASRFGEECYLHSHRVPAAAWREWAKGSEFQDCLQERSARLRLPAELYRRRIAEASSAEGWKGLARLDAALRRVEGLVQRKVVRRGKESASLIEVLLEGSEEGCAALLEKSMWSVVG